MFRLALTTTDVAFETAKEKVELGLMVDSKGTGVAADGISDTLVVCHPDE